MLKFNSLFKLASWLVVHHLYISAVGSEINTVHIETRGFGKLPDGSSVILYTLANNNGIEVSIINFGAIIVSLQVPDASGKSDDIVLGFETLEEYLSPHPYFGAVIGRYANRIANGRFNISGKTYQLPVNLPPHHLHGGISGFDKKLYSARTTETESYVALELSRVSPHMEEGYPGDLQFSVKYILWNDNKLEIEYAARTDSPTIVNFTNHSYFNLKGCGNGDILDTWLMINADKITETDEHLIPTGKFIDIEGTPLDFRESRMIGTSIDASHRLMDHTGGYDHCFAIKEDNDELTLAARAEEKESGRVMEVYTTEPALQLYTANFGDGTFKGKGSKIYKARYGFCLETQHFPDSPAHDNFPGTVLRPGELFSSKTVLKFSTL